MTSILPQIEILQEIPFFHKRYAEIVLKLIVDKLLCMNEFEIGTGNGKGSVIGFDADDFENVQIELQYFDFKFVLIVNEHSEENFASTFTYKIFEDSPLYKMIPEKLIAAMGQVADEKESVTYKPKLR